MSHFYKICIKCEKIFSQCRCPGPHKIKQNGICHDCVAKALGAEKMTDKEVSEFKRKHNIYE